MDLPAVFEVPGLIDDTRVRVFRRLITLAGICNDMPVDCYVITTHHFIVICDTLLCPADMALIMGALGDTLRGRRVLVFNSHADWDHAWGNSYFSGKYAAPIIAHDACRSRLKSPETQELLHEFRQRYEIFREVTIQPPDLTFSSHLTLHGGDLSLECFAAPGHCKDHAAIWLPELHLLLAFDALEWPLPILEQPDGTPSLIATLEWFLQLQPRTVLCSHSKASPQLIGENLAYLHGIVDHCHRLIASHGPVLATAEQEALLSSIPSPLDRLNGAPENDVAFYRTAHQQNVRITFEWLTRETRREV